MGKLRPLYPLAPPYPQPPSRVLRSPQCARLLRALALRAGVAGRQPAVISTCGKQTRGQRFELRVERLLVHAECTTYANNSRFGRLRESACCQELVQVGLKG